jgi:hypothetical protein
VHDIVSLLRSNPNFRRLWLGRWSASSATGSATSRFTALLFDLTGSATRGRVADGRTDAADSRWSARAPASSSIATIDDES